MKRFVMAAVAASAILAGAGAASAQTWLGINQEQARLEARINQGVRGGGLTPAEAAQLRAEWKQIAIIEGQYRRSGGGLSVAEKADLARRFAILDARIYLSRTDRDYARNWRGINARQAELERRIDVGVRNGQLTRAEAVRLRAEFRQIQVLEANYRRSGGHLSLAEKRDLDRRMDLLQRRIRAERTDRQGR